MHDTRSPDVRKLERKAALCVAYGGVIPLDVAAALMERGVNMDALERRIAQGAI